MNDFVMFQSNPLKCCPFCGEEPYVTSCDRLITIGCKCCNYHRNFHGLLQSEMATNVVTSYALDTGKPIEWYDKNAYENAAKQWNRRINDERRDAG